MHLFRTRCCIYDPQTNPTPHSKGWECEFEGTPIFQPMLYANDLHTPLFNSLQNVEGATISRIEYRPHHYVFLLFLCFFVSIVFVFSLFYRTDTRLKTDENKTFECFQLSRCTGRNLFSIVFVFFCFLLFLCLTGSAYVPVRRLSLRPSKDSLKVLFFCFLLFLYFFCFYCFCVFFVL